MTARSNLVNLSLMSCSRISQGTLFLEKEIFFSTNQTCPRMENWCKCLLEIQIGWMSQSWSLFSIMVQQYFITNFGIKILKIFRKSGQSCEIRTTIVRFYHYLISEIFTHSETNVKHFPSESCHTCAKGCCMSRMKIVIVLEWIISFFPKKDTLFCRWSPHLLYSLRKEHGSGASVLPIYLRYHALGHLYRSD